ncbi:hypothetical protein ACFPPF_16515 [Xenophilus aerolatus]|nr:hypothetical protein [Xenophilus aerolatus]
MTRLTNRLRVAIATACAVRGDSDAYMAESLEGGAELLYSQQVDLAEHFEREARLRASVNLAATASGSFRAGSSTGNSRRTLRLFTGPPRGVK